MENQPTSPKTMLELRNEIGAWANRNFKIHAPEIGILEEIGEVAHVILKTKQGIRGYDDTIDGRTKTLADLSDAVADIGVYTLHHCYLRGLTPPERIQIIGTYDDVASLSDMASLASMVLDGQSRDVVVKEIMECCATIAFRYGIDFQSELRKTWEKVCLRDWQKNPANAAQIAAGAVTGNQHQVLAAVAFVSGGGGTHSS